MLKAINLPPRTILDTPHEYLYVFIRISIIVPHSKYFIIFIGVL